MSLLRAKRIAYWINRIGWLAGRRNSRPGVRFLMADDGWRWRWLKFWEHLAVVTWGGFAYRYLVRKEDKS